jgi:hypothetical protein
MRTNKSNSFNKSFKKELQSENAQKYFTKKLFKLLINKGSELMDSLILVKNNYA